jgi:hypothetical protein
MRMDEVNVCPRCSRCADLDKDACPYCGTAFTPSKPEKNKTDRPGQDPLDDPLHLFDRDNKCIIHTAHPERLSFLYNYLMALIPAVLVIVSIFAQKLMENLFDVGTSSMTSAVPTYMTSYTAGFASQYSSSISGVTDITILLIAPVGIFLFIVALGWALRLTELWASTALTLGLSALTALILVTWAGAPPLSGNYTLTFLQWIAYLVQPYCVISAILVILGTEKFRQSIHYTITGKGLWIRGGFIGIQEHMIPHHLMGRVVFEQDYFGTLFNYGTLIPQSVTRWGAETSYRGIGATGQKDNFGIGIGYAKGREEGSRHPLDCLYGVADPKRVQKILTGLLCRQEQREEDQVSYLRKIYEVSVAGVPAREFSPGPRISTDNAGCVVQNGALSGSLYGSDVLLNVQGVPDATPTIRIHDADFPAPACFPGDNIREIPPLPRQKSVPAPNPPLAEPVLDQIKKMAELKDSGILTEEEFVLKKTELLKRL